MCLNCGCMMPDNDMGNSDNITTQKIVKAGKAGGNKNIKDVMENMVKTYQMTIKGTPVDTKPIWLSLNTYHVMKRPFFYWKMAE